MLSEKEKLERLLAWHCAPALAGIKPADLVAWEPPERGGEKLLGEYSFMLTRRGIRLRVLGRSGERFLLLIYRPGRLEDCLREERVASMLSVAGYPPDGGVEVLLNCLRCRLREREFPHEIGLFLGYPPEDVEGFCRDGGKHCRYAGTWKVYGDVEGARRRFEAFHRCRLALYRRVSGGISLAQVFPAA